MRSRPRCAAHRGGSLPRIERASAALFLLDVSRIGTLARRRGRYARQAGVLRQEFSRGFFRARSARARVLLAGAGRLPARYQMVFAVADEVGAAHAFQRLAQQRPVVGVVITQKGLVQAADLESLRYRYLFTCARDLAQRILARVIHRGRQRRRQKGLHLIGAEAVAVQPQRELQHVFIDGAGVRRDEIRNQILFLAGLLRILVEQLLEFVVGAHARLHHLRQRPLLGVLGRDLQIAADMVLHGLLHVLGRADRVGVAQARGDQYLLDAGQGARAAVELDERRVIGVEIRANVGIDAGQPPARGLDLDALAAQTVHVRRGAADIGDHAGEAGHGVANALDLANDRVFRAALDDAALMLGDGAEGAAAKAAAHDVHREADHLVRGDVRIAVARVRPPRIGQDEHAVELLGGERDRRRVDPHLALAVTLHQRARIAWIGLEVQHARSVCIQHRIVFHGLEGGHADYAVLAVMFGHSALEADDFYIIIRLR